MYGSHLNCMFAKLYSKNNDSDPNRCTLKSYSQQRGSEVFKISYSYSLFVTTITSHSGEAPFGKQVWFILDARSQLVWYGNDLFLNCTIRLVYTIFQKLCGGIHPMVAGASV